MNSSQEAIKNLKKFSKVLEGLQRNMKIDSNTGEIIEEVPENNKVKIGYKEYEIVKEPEIIEVAGEYFGKTEPNEEKIFIASKYMQKQQNQTFLHELLHCIADKYNLEVNRDEHTIELLSVGLYEAILDNPHIFTMKDI